MYEPFLVRSVRDEVRRRLESLSDTGEGDRRRAEDRERIEYMANNPDSARALLAETDPYSAAALTDAEIAAQLRRLLDRGRARAGEGNERPGCPPWAAGVSSTLEGPLDWPDATVVSGDAVDVVARLKEKSGVPLRSHGSLSMNHALMAAGLVDRVQVTLFPVITGQTGVEPIFGGAADFDLELIESRTLDGNIQELIYRPALHA
jgi:hypothetical protein